MKRLVDTGLFTSLSWRYEPKTASGMSGVALTLQVEEAAPDGTVVFDIDGLDEQELRERLKRQNALIDTQIPASQEATRYYLAAVKIALEEMKYEQDIVAKNEVVLETGIGEGCGNGRGIADDGRRASPVQPAADGARARPPLGP